jgi:hypothetical protein
MHLSIDSKGFAVRAEYHSRVVIKTSCSFLKKAGDKSDLVFLCRGGEDLRGRTWNGFGQIKAGVILFLAKIERAEQLRKAHQFGSPPGGL